MLRHIILYLTNLERTNGREEDHETYPRLRRSRLQKFELGETLREKWNDHNNNNTCHFRYTKTTTTVTLTAWWNPRCRFLLSLFRASRCSRASS